MKFLSCLKRFLRLHVYNPEWRCALCGEENFDGGFICAQCEKDLPYNDGYICNHCGRETEISEEYCLTCKDNLIAIEKARSVFSYERPISTLITHFKYDNHRYLVEYFVNKMAMVYLKNFFSADFISFVPMLEKDEKKRGYNQSKLLAEGLATKLDLPLNACVEKSKQTQRQAKLTRKERLKNLKGAFKVVNKKTVKDKVVLLVDDVTTTGATAETVATALKKAGAKLVYLLTVASTPSKNNRKKDKKPKL